MFFVNSAIKSYIQYMYARPCPIGSQFLNCKDPLSASPDDLQAWRAGGLAFLVVKIYLKNLHFYLMTVLLGCHSYSVLSISEGFALITIKV